MTFISTLTLLLFMTVIFGIHGQWFILKKDHRPGPMNYPNPGKRSITDDELKSINVDCSIPYKHLSTYEEKTTWLLSCNYEKESSLSKTIKDSDESYSISPLTFEQRRIPRAIPPYFYERPEFFNQRQLLKRIRRIINE